MWSQCKHRCFWMGFKNIHLCSLKSTSHGQAIFQSPCTCWLLQKLKEKAWSPFRESLIPIFLWPFLHDQQKSLNYKLPHYKSSSLFPSDRFHASTIKVSRVQAMLMVWRCADTETLAVSWILHLQFHIQSISHQGSEIPYKQSKQ